MAGAPIALIPSNEDCTHITMETAQVNSTPTTLKKVGMPNGIIMDAPETFDIFCSAPVNGIDGPTKDPKVCMLLQLHSCCACVIP